MKDFITALFGILLMLSLLVFVVFILAVIWNCSDFNVKMCFTGLISSFLCGLIFGILKES